MASFWSNLVGVAKAGLVALAPKATTSAAAAATPVATIGATVISQAQVSAVVQLGEWAVANLSGLASKPSLAGALDVGEEVVATIAAIDPAAVPEAALVETALQAFAWIAANALPPAAAGGQIWEGPQYARGR